MTFSKEKTAHVYIRVTDMKDNTIKLSDMKYIDDYVYEHIKNYTINASDLYLTIAGTIGSVGVVPKEVDGMNLTENAAKLTQIGCIKEYLLYALLSTIAQEHFTSRFHQVAQPKLSIETASKTPIAMPPIGEQNRIVKEIKRYLAAIKIIEEGQTDLETTISQAKSKILDLAIHGKLVPQDPTDEPATELLKRINPKAEITCDNPQYENLPNGWCRCTLKDIGIFESGYAFSSDEYKQNGVPLVRISNITNNGNIDLSSCVYIQNYNNSKFIIHEGDLLIAMSGATTGKMGVYKYKTDALLNQRVGNLKCTEAWLQQYRNYFMLAKSNYILNIAYGGAQPNISAKAILSIEIDLPPINEQHRIVAKIEELFTQLDNITSSL